MVKSVVLYVLLTLRLDKSGNINIPIILDCFEILLALYLLYNFYVFSLCLSYGRISEYQPLQKFYWFYFLMIVVVVQKILVHIFGELIVNGSVYSYSEDESNSLGGHRLSMEINSVLKCVEIIIFLCGILNHF
jgi:hypothetical protein